MSEGKSLVKGFVIRGLFTILLIFGYGWVNALLNPVETLAVGKIAGMQFENSDSTYVTSFMGTRFFHDFHIPIILLIAAIVFLWWKPLKGLLKTTPVILILILLCGSTSFAYYDKQDWNEPYFILPNESAFWVPDVGNNKGSQAKFGSEDYYRENKIAAKRFSVPHVKLENSGLWRDMYVPAGRLIIVDRTPYSREWVTHNDRGSSNKNEGFPLQSKEGINLTAGISIGASVMEEDSPRFLYRFGVKPPRGNRSTPEVIFTSVFEGKSLTEVMDDVVRKKVEELLSNEFTKREFVQCNEQSEEIMKSVNINLTKWLKEVGITLDFIGWADTFEFDKEIQQAINRTYIAKQDKKIAEALAPHVQTIQALAFAELTRQFGAKTDGKLPTSISIWGSVKDIVGDIFGSMNGMHNKQASPVTTSNK